MNFYTVTQLTDDGDMLPFRFIFKTLAAAKQAVDEVFAETYEDEEVKVEWRDESDECSAGCMDDELFIIQKVSIME